MHSTVQFHWGGGGGGGGECNVLDTFTPQEYSSRLSSYPHCIWSSGHLHFSLLTTKRPSLNVTDENKTLSN